EESRGALARSGSEDGRVDEGEVALIEEVAAGLLDLAADFQDGVLLRGTQPEMADVHEERGAVLLRTDGVVVGGRYDLERLHAELDAALRARLRAHDADDFDGGFLADALDRVPGGFVDFFPDDNALQVAAAVANDRKLDLPRGALVVQPAVDDDALPDVV